MRYKNKGIKKAKNKTVFIFLVLLFGLFIWDLSSWPAPAAAAAIYSFVDNKGVWHFTNVPSDPRFSRREFTDVSATIRGTGRRKVVRRKKTGDYQSVIKKAAGSFGLDPALIKAVIRAESGGDPLAISSKGALGLMQLMPGTAEELMVYDPLDPEENIWGGSRYLSRLLDMFDGDIISALAAYNSGPGTVNRYGGLPPYQETINYVQRVLRFWKQSKF